MTQCIQCNRNHGYTIDALEAQMRPGAAGERGSIMGFLGTDEELENLLQADHKTLDELGIEHSALAEAIRKSAKVHSRYRGAQHCPFDNCNNSSNQDLVIINTWTREYLYVPGLVTHLIEEHHFFEGTGPPCRVDPIKACHVLELKPRSATNFAA